MRIYLVVIDDSPEAEIALRFAARRAVKTGGGVEILTLIPPQEFIAFGGVQATIEEEALQHAEGLVAAAAGTLVAESGLKPAITVRQGDGPRSSARSLRPIPISPRWCWARRPAVRRASSSRISPGPTQAPCPSRS